MLESSRVPDLNPRDGAGHNPGPEDKNLLDGLVEVGGDVELGHLPPPLEDPEALRPTAATIAPCREDLLLPGYGGCDVRRGLGTADEDEVQSALEVVGLEGSADGGGDLEGRLAEGNRGEGNTCRGHKANGLRGR